MESVKICHFKTFRAGNFAFRTFGCFFLHYIHVKKFVCEDISAEYEFESVILRDGVCQNLSFQSMFGENFCTENLVSV